jgi:hypothetical protein
MEAQQEDATSGGRPLLEGWLSREQVAAELGISVDTLARWRTRRIGPPCVRLGRKILYRDQAFRDWLLASERKLVARPKDGGAQ